MRSLQKFSFASLAIARNMQQQLQCYYEIDLVVRAGPGNAGTIFVEFAKLISGKAQERYVPDVTTISLRAQQYRAIVQQR